MKGIVFTEFLDLVEERFGLQTLDKVIEKAAPESGAVYTSVGTYEHAEMVKLVTALSETIDVPIGDLLKEYGNHFFDVLYKSYPVFFEEQKGMLDFLEKIESYIHPQVLKLYPDAELPSFNITRPAEDELIMEYHSKRAMADFAHGLIRGCMRVFKEEYQIEREPVSEDGSVVRFHLKPTV